MSISSVEEVLLQKFILLRFWNKLIFKLILFFVYSQVKIYLKLKDRYIDYKKMYINCYLLKRF